jgi:diguanylate cyclase (GGDEF)-like protein
VDPTQQKTADEPAATSIDDEANPPCDSQLRLPRRMALSHRLTIALVTMALLSTTIAVVAQDRALARDLESAAATRLDRSARAGEQVVAEHLTALGERYRTIARTPQLRATLELSDQPTLRFLAEELARQNGASAVAFLDSSGTPIASSGDAQLLAMAPNSDGQFLRASSRLEALFATTRVALETRGQSFGSLVVFERIDEQRLRSWSQLCGASIALDFDGELAARAEAGLIRTIEALNEGSLVASSGLEAERAAVANARTELIRAGIVALAISILACFALARNLVRPIEQIQRAIDRIRRGNLATPLLSTRGDEIGDVARGIDRMAIELQSSRDELDLRIEELDRSRTHLASAQQLARIGSLEVDLHSGSISGSQEFFVLLGTDPTTAESKIDVQEVIQRIHESDRESVLDTVRECIRTGVSARLDHRMVVGDAERVMHTQLQVVRGDDGQAFRLEGTMQDVTERRRAEKQIRFLAHHDSLTGLGNRLHFKERVELAITQARRRDSGFGILFLDLDHFKRINDTLGHSVGDEVLKSVADRIEKCLRPTDEITRGGDATEELLISRLGGDEFTLILPDIQDPNTLAPVAQRILDTLSRPFELPDHEIVIGASIGIATWPQDGHDIDTLLRNVDSAMYQAKSDGRNNYKYYEESMNATAVHRLELETRLRREVEQKSVDVHFQPRIDLETGRTSGFEALARWRDSKFGQVSPAEFIPIAEHTGLIVPLTQDTFRKVCRQAAEWETGAGHFDGRISVNFSARQFKLADVPQDISDALAETRVSPHRLEVEVTESVMLHDEQRVIDALYSIREMGITIALDDFGTGYSSLSYLRRLPIDVLKIDIAFIRDITTSREDAALARAIIAMADALGLAVVAEGVETVEQRDLLREWGCEEMQGFLASPAIPAEDALEWLVREKERLSQDSG